MKFKFFVFQILTEQVCTQVVHKPHPEPDSTVKIQNPSEPTAVLCCNAVVMWSAHGPKPKLPPPPASLQCLRGWQHLQLSYHSAKPLVESQQILFEWEI